MYAVLDPDPDIRGGGGGPVSQKVFLLWSKNRRGGGGGSHPSPSTTGMYVPNLNCKYGHFTFWGVGHTPVSIQPYFTHNCMSFLAISSSLLLLLLVIILPWWMAQNYKVGKDFSTFGTMFWPIFPSGLSSLLSLFPSQLVRDQWGIQWERLRVLIWRGRSENSPFTMQDSLANVR